MDVIGPNVDPLNYNFNYGILQSYNYNLRKCSEQKIDQNCRKPLNKLDY